MNCVNTPDYITSIGYILGHPCLVCRRGRKGIKTGYFKSNRQEKNKLYNCNKIIRLVYKVILITKAKKTY